MAELVNLEGLSDEVKKRVVPYLQNLFDVHNENIVSVFVYGSAAGKDFVPKRSDINLLIVFRQLQFDDLKKSLKIVSKGIEKKITAPLFLTRRHIETSADVFPVEFMELKENHILLYGEDIWENLKIDNANIRLQCEEQIKGKLIRLRQAYLEVGLKRKGIEALIKESLYALLPIFRNMLRLKGKTPPVGKEDILISLCAEFDLDADIFLAILKDKKDDEKIGSQEIEPAFERYLGEIHKLALAVDKL